MIFQGSRLQFNTVSLLIQDCKSRFSQRMPWHLLIYKTAPGRSHHVCLTLSGHSPRRKAAFWNLSVHEWFRTPTVSACFSVPISEGRNPTGPAPSDGSQGTAGPLRACPPAAATCRRRLSGQRAPGRGRSARVAGIRARWGAGTEGTLALEQLAPLKSLPCGR